MPFPDPYHTNQTSLGLAEEVASYFGGHVASINDADEQHYLDTWVRGYGFQSAQIAIGLTDDGHPGTYTWLDGTPLTYTNWDPGYPAAPYDTHYANLPFTPSIGTTQIVEFEYLARSGDARGWQGGWRNISEPNWWPDQSHAYLLELPGVHTPSELNAAVDSGAVLGYVRQNYCGDIRYNAFLSKYWDPNINHWMRFQSQPSSSGSYAEADFNFWGTTTASLIDHAIVDYYDNFTSARADYGPPLPHGAVFTFPFVERVLINGLPAETVPLVSSGPATFAVTFNRPMDPATQPYVTFGPSAPETDFTVHPMGASQAEFTVVLSTPCSQAVTVDYATEDDTALAGVDYHATRGTVTFKPGDISKTVAVPLIGDQVAESDRTFRLRLSSPTVVLIDDGLATGTIQDDDGTLSVSDVSVPEPQSGTANAVFTVSLSKPSAENVTVEYATQDGNAKGGVDYDSTSGVLTFAPGQTEQTVTVVVRDDAVNETDREFSLRLSHATMVNIADDRAQGTILGGAPALSINDVQVVNGVSGTTNAAFTVTLSKATGETVTVHYATANNSATAGQDYQAVSGTLTFLPGETAKSFVVPVIGGPVQEPVETFFAELSSPSNAIVADGQGEGRILSGLATDDNLALTFDDVSVAEGNAGTTSAVFTVRLSAVPANTVTVHYRTHDGTAVAGEDYLPATGMLTFVPGQTVQTIAVPILGDTVDERDETFTVELHTAGGAALPAGPATGTILDDDPMVRIGDARLVEGNDGPADMTFTVSVAANPDLPIVVHYATADGTALAGSDYLAAGGTLTFEPGGALTQTIAVTVLGDTDVETNEKFYVNLTSDSGVALADAQGQGTIVADDGPLFSIADASFQEGDDSTTYAAFTVALSADPPQTVTVHYRTADGTATAGADYNLAETTLTFRPGGALQQTVYVPILGDTASEADETFYVDLLDSTVVGIAHDQATGTILDDDPAITIDDVSVVEGESGATILQFTATLSEDPVDTMTVHWATAGQTATQGTDYLGASGILTFQPGQGRTRTMNVLVLDDTTNEVDETFVVNLTGAANGNIADAQGRATILDDDGPKIRADDVSVAEGDTGTTDAVFTVSLTGLTDVPITVTYAAADGTAAAGRDFQAAAGTLTFLPGQSTSQTVTVHVLGDLVDETDETFFLRLSDATAAPIADAEGAAADEGYNGWVNDRQWQGTFWITPVTGEGYQLMRISGAEAADDPWLVSGYDVGRIKFEVRTMGVTAMALQATGQEGAVRLSWQQDDFDLLAGYNLYRSTSLNGTYTKINQTVIPVGHEYWLDTNVAPAVPMYCKFTVLTTDMTESTFSNVASAAALDTIPPAISHTPVMSAAPGAGLRLTAHVTDNVGVTGVQVHYRTSASGAAWTDLPMVNISGNDWSVTISGSSVRAPGVDYYLTATDGISTVYDGAPGAPHQVVVNASPAVTSVSPSEGPSAGGMPVTVAGAMFQAGAVVRFGGQPASGVTVLSGNQINCITPPHFPAMADVTVVNPDGTQATLLNGFRYVNENVVVSMPHVSGDSGTFIEVPVIVSNVDGLLAADLTVTFNSAVLRAASLRLGTLTPGWFQVSNTSSPGTVLVSLASSTSVTGSGDLVYIRFEVVGAPTSGTDLTIASATLNGGAVSCFLGTGHFTVNALFDLSGSVSYYTGRPVAGVTMSLAGVGASSTATDPAGAFAFIDVPTGAYTLTPTKNDELAEITAYDASLVLQKAVGLISLSANQTVAADVDRSGAVNSMDASYILQESVGLLTPPFPGAGRTWDFVPSSRSYSLINGDQTGQNFTAVLIGDVSGNWQPPVQPQGPLGLAEPLGAAGPESCSLSLPSVSGQAGDLVTVPLTLARGEHAVYAADVVLNYDPAKLAVRRVVAGAAANGAFYAANATQAGIIRIGLAAAQPLAADGAIAEITFQVIAPLAQPAAISLQVGRVNEDPQAAALIDGAIRDNISPTVQSVELHTTADQQWLDIRFSEDLSSIPADALLLTGAVTGQTVDPGSMMVAYDPATRTARWTFPGLPGGRLPYGQAFAATLPAAAGADLAGNALDGNADGLGGDDLAAGFMAALPGDADIDGCVDMLDYLTLKANFGQGTAAWSRADFTGDGVVDCFDLLKLEANFGLAIRL